MSYQFQQSLLGLTGATNPPAETALDPDEIMKMFGSTAPGPTGPAELGHLLVDQRSTGVTGTVVAAVPTKMPLVRGVYSNEVELIELLNAHYLVGKSEQDVAIYRIRADGLLTFIPQEQFKLDVGNIF